MARRGKWTPREVVWVSVDCEDCVVATMDQHRAMGSTDFFRRETYLTTFTTADRSMDDIFDRPGTTNKYRSKVLFAEAGADPMLMILQVADALTRINQEVWSQGKTTRLIGHNVLYDLVCMFRDQLGRYTDVLALTSRLIKGRIYDDLRDMRQAIEVWDSFNWSTGSLKNIGKTIGYPKMDGELVAEGRPLTNEERLSLIPYNQRDTEIVLEYGEKLRAEFQALFGVELGPTIAGTSAKVIHAHLEKHHEDTWEAVNTPEALAAYFGGRVECFHMGEVTGDIGAWDINSSYPNAMVQEFPNLKSLSWYGDEDIRNLRDLRRNPHGIAHVTLHIPANPNNDARLVPPLPYKGKDGAVHFPAGTITGWYVVPEILHAIDWGAKLVKFHEGWLTDKVVRYFEPVVRPGYEKRQEVKREKPVTAETLKLFLNAGYGKFAEQKPRTSVIGLVRGVDAVLAHEGNDQAEILAESEGLTTVRFPLLEPPPTANYLIGSYITAYARINLHKALHAIAVNPDLTLLYCDTDSAYVWIHKEGALPDIEIHEKKLGAWKQEKAAYFRTFGPKNYICLAQDDDGEGYHWTFKTKGWKPSPKQVEAWCVAVKKDEVAEAIERFQTRFNPIWNYLCLCEAEVCKPTPTKLVSSIRRGVRPGEWYEGEAAPTKRLKPESRYTRRREIDGGKTLPKRAPKAWAEKREYTTPNGGEA